VVIWTPPACPSDKSRGDATTSSRGAYGASYIVFPLQRRRPPFFGRAGSPLRTAHFFACCCTTATAAGPLTISAPCRCHWCYALPATRSASAAPTRQFAFRLAFMEETGMGDAATSGAGYIAGREAEEDWAMAVTRQELASLGSRRPAMTQKPKPPRPPKPPAPPPPEPLPPAA